MSIIEVHLFEMALKGDRLDEINAEEVLNRRAAAQAKARARSLYLRRCVQKLATWAMQPQTATGTPMDVMVK